MKTCERCNNKIGVLTRLKSIGDECTYIQCSHCKTTYEMESRDIAKMINLLMFFMVFYVVYSLINLMEIDFELKIKIVFALAFVYYFVWNIGLSYFAEYKIIETKSTSKKVKKDKYNHKNN